MMTNKFFKGILSPITVDLLTTNALISITMKTTSQMTNTPQTIEHRFISPIILSVRMDGEITPRKNTISSNNNPMYHVAGTYVSCGGYLNWMGISMGM